MNLAQNKILAVQYRKMRDAKDLTRNSAADMADTFRVKVDAYS